MQRVRELKWILEVVYKSVSPQIGSPNSRFLQSVDRPAISTVSRRWTTSSSNVEKTTERKDAEDKKKAKRKEIHITVIHPDKTVTHSTLEDANKLSNRRNLKLVKVSDYDRKRDSPVYMMMTAAQFREEALSLKKSNKSEDKKGPYKGEKLLPINAKISDHDLESKTHKILGWLEKNFEIRVTISANNPEDKAMTEKVYNSIETSIGSQGRILQKRTSGNDIKFQVVPPKAPKSPKNSKSSDSKVE